MLKLKYQNKWMKTEYNNFHSVIENYKYKKSNKNRYKVICNCLFIDLTDLFVLQMWFICLEINDVWQ